MVYDLVIQIVNYNTKHYLAKCLNSLLNDLRNTEINYKISILDNNSNDDLSDIQKSNTGEKISFYFSKKNLGFGGGHNYLAKRTDAKYILILNPDIKIIEHNTIKRLYRKIEKNDNIKVIGPKLLTKNKIVQPWDHGELKGLIAKIALMTGNSYWKNRNNIAEVAWVSGAVFLIEKKVFNKIDGFDEKFFLYKEEEDLCLRIRKLNYKILYDPTVKILHYGSSVASKSKYIKKSVDYYLDKHFKDKIGHHLFKLINVIVNH